MKTGRIRLKFFDIYKNDQLHTVVFVALSWLINLETITENP